MRIANYCGFITILTGLMAGGCSRGPADETIATEIKAKFYADPRVKPASLSVAVAKGEVTLGGTVTSLEIELQAYKLAMNTEGVRKLHDQIVVAPAAPMESVEPAPASHPAVARVNEEPYVPSPPPPPDEIREVHQAPSPPVNVVVVETPAPVVVERHATPAAYYVPPAADEFKAPSNEPSTEHSIEPRKPRSHEPVVLVGAGSASQAALYEKFRE